MRNRPVPGWARKRARQQEADANARWYARHGSLVGVGLVPALWSNSAGKPFHLTCRALAPADAFELSLEADKEGACGACGEPL